VMFPARDFNDRAAAEFALREVSAPEGLLLGEFEPDTTYVGKTIADISKLRGTDPATTLMALIHESMDLEKKVGHGTESVIGTSMDERDIEKIIAWPYANFCSDGELDGRHPRGFGAFTRVLGRYVRERKVITLEDAIRKMTNLAATNVNIPDRGLIAPGRYADLVLFDPKTVLDLATPTDPQHPSVGIQTVWVNGEVVFDGGKTTGRHPGRVIRRPHS
jgi:N-acyl-D-amino-acid deacylase